MPSVLVVLLLERPNELRHFHRRDVSSSLAFGEPFDSSRRVRIVGRHEACHLSPVEHAADDFKQVICCVGVSRADFRVNKFNVGRDNARDEVDPEFRKESAS